MTPIEKLDEVLKEVSKHYKGIIMQDLYAHLAQKYHIKNKDNSITGIITGNELERIVLKLQDDKYISSISKHLSPSNPMLLEYYFTTFDGNLLVQNNGYTGLKWKQRGKIVLKGMEIFVLLASAIGAVYYARQSYLESVKHDTLEIENRMLLKDKQTEDSIIKGKENEVFNLINAQKLLRNKIDSLEKHKKN